MPLNQILLRYKEDCGWKVQLSETKLLRRRYWLFLCISNTHTELGPACHHQRMLSMFIAQAREPPISCKVRVLSFSAAQRNIRFCVSGSIRVADVLTGSCLWVKKGYYCHYFFLVKCLLQTRCHMGWRALPILPGPSTTAWMMLHGDAPGWPASERL